MFPPPELQSPAPELLLDGRHVAYARVVRRSPALVQVDVAGVRVTFSRATGLPAATAPAAFARWRLATPAGLLALRGLRAATWPAGRRRA